MIGLITLIALLGYLLSLFFLLDADLNLGSSLTMGYFINLSTWSVGIVVGTNVILHALPLYLVQFDFTASCDLLGIFALTPLELVVIRLKPKKAIQVH